MKQPVFKLVLLVVFFLCLLFAGFSVHRSNSVKPDLYIVRHAERQFRVELPSEVAELTDAIEQANFHFGGFTFFAKGCLYRVSSCDKKGKLIRSFSLHSGGISSGNIRYNGQTEVLEEVLNRLSSKYQ
ncbi:hypothetical protein [Anaerolentibacter hominis]|uniref:hypothetical protein n=1 Tax=Anaerolentibacter hominis TaxID=3079009 RepID=UPI0031B82ED4